MSILRNQLVCLAFVVVVTIECVALTIVPRKEWGAAPPKNTPTPLQTIPTDLVVIHHGDSSSCSTKEDCSGIVRAYQRHHVNDNGWDDIGYNFVVGEDGNVYEGRGWNVTGAHAPKVNSRSVGICIIGNFTSEIPNEAAIAAVRDLIDFGIETRSVSRDYKLIGHRQVRDTECPGDAFYSEIQTWPHYSPTV